MNPPSVPPRSLQLLHLEDNAADAELIHLTLAAEWPDCRIQRVQTERDFVAALENATFDLILSDFSMPGFNGMDALTLARRLQAGTPFLFLSGTIGEERAVEALKTGATDYVIKDRMRRLTPAVRRALAEVEERRSHQQAELLFRRAQRLESVGMLAGGIAHDLNNVLAPILMAVGLMRQKCADQETLHLLQVLETSAQHGAGLIRQVLAFARGVDGERADLQPQLVARDVAELLSETLPRSIVLETELPKDLWLVQSNSTELGQVLMNLCVNARDAMPQGGRLRICLRNEQVDAALAAANPGAAAGPHVLIAVTDDGSGIPPEVREHIFDPFFTTKVSGKGTGLGLATVLGIVKSHGGFLQVESEMGHGTEFRLYFPAVTAAAAAPEPSAAEAAARGGGETILVIEDELSVLSVVRSLLQARGYAVLTAVDGTAGLEIYQARAREIQVVLTDMMMPGIQGPELVGRLRAVNPEVCIVAMSGLIDECAALGEENDRLGFLRKPMTAQDLVRAIQRVLPRAG